jgi:NAD(P)-dependent dehydrogenase (short-subunit alcohol dehydrogenase family)
MNYRILVTGASAPAGRSMIDALAHEPATLLACDTRVGAVDALPTAHCFNVHRSDDPEFVGDLVTLCALHEVDVVVPTRASDQLALANVRKLFEGLGTRVWLAPIAEHATRSQARRIIQLGEQVRGQSTVGKWFRRLSNLAQEQHHHSA